MLAIPRDRGKSELHNQFQCVCVCVMLQEVALGGLESPPLMDTMFPLPFTSGLRGYDH